MLTVGEIRRAIEKLDDDTKVTLVDQYADGGEYETYFLQAATIAASIDPIDEDAIGCDLAYDKHGIAIPVEDTDGEEVLLLHI